MKTTKLHAPAHGRKSTMQAESTRLFVLLHELHKGFLVDQARISPMLRDTQVSKTELGKALVDQVNGGMDV